MCVVPPEYTFIKGLSITDQSKKNSNLMSVFIKEV